MSMIKYRVHEVAKDFGLPTKAVTQILTDYAATPKNHMQVLETSELDVIFEYITQHNQVESLEEIFKVEPKAVPQPEEKKHDSAPAAKAEPGAKPAAPAPAAKAPAPAPQKAEKKDKPHVPRQVAEKRVVDTRGGAAVNIEKYNEKFEDLAGSRGGKSLKSGQSGKKEKIGGKSKQRQNAQVTSAKRRQEERDKMQRLQLEIAT